MTSPTIILGMPRSRTAWLSAFLSTPDRPFLHEPSVHWHGLHDLRTFLSNADAAACDSGLTLFWRDILAFRPDVTLIVIHRSEQAVFASLIDAGIPLPRDIIRRLRVLSDATAEASMRAKFSADFDELKNPFSLRNLYRTAIGHECPDGWLQHWQDLRVQANWRARFLAAESNAEGFPAVLESRLAAKQAEV